MRIRRIEPQSATAKKRVTAYARVSTLSEGQEDSFETQVQYYTQKITANPNWIPVPIYSDHGFSALSAENRPGFMRMIEDAKNNKFDVILVKGISRFCRNTGEAQEYVKLLKHNKVEVIFEREGISSFDSTAEMAFNVLTACAQEESRSISERTKWGVHKRMALGIYKGYGQALGYDRVDDELKPNHDAWIIRRIFIDYANGLPMKAITDNLTEKGAITLKSHSLFTAAHIMKIISNEIYVGDRLMQKQAPNHYLTHKPDLTVSYDCHFIKDNHQGIISRELWDKAQARKEKDAADKSKGIRKNSKSHFLYGKLVCRECGALYSRNKQLYKGEMVFVWRCHERAKGKKGNGCKNGTISEKEVLDKIAQQVGTDEVTGEDFDRVIIWKDGTVEIVEFVE